MTTPNATFVPSPPFGSARPLYRRVDGRYGEDDFTQWPQPYSTTNPHHAAIPCKMPTGPLSIMWLDPGPGDFEDLVSSGRTILGFKKLAVSHLKSLRSAVVSLVDRAQTYESKNPQRLKTLQPHTQTMVHALVRLESLGMSHQETLFGLRDIQRCWLEVTALLDYMEVYCPRMNGERGVSVAGTQPEIATTIGAFTTNPRVLQDHFVAGLSIWFVQPVDNFTTQNIWQVVQHTTPQERLSLENCQPQSRIIYTGPAGDDAKVDAIFRAVRQSHELPDPFRSAPPSVPTTLSLPGPSNPTPPPQTSGPSVRTTSERRGRGRAPYRGKPPYQLRGPREYIRSLSTYHC